MTFKRWFLLLITLIFAFVVTADIIIFVMYFAAKLYLYVVRDVPLTTYLPGFLRLIRGASFGGLIAGIGCWYIYYKNEKM